MALWEVAVDQSIVGSDRPVVNVFHAVTQNEDPPEAMLQYLANQWQTVILPYQTTSLRFERMRARELGGIGYAERSIGQNGTATTGGQVPNVALLLRKVTPGLPRRRYGRMFIAGMPETECDAGGNWSSGVITGWSERMVTMLSAWKVAGFPMVQIASLNETDPAVGITSIEVAQIVPVVKAASMKRRLRR